MVKQGIDRELDKIKDRYDGLNSLLKHVALDIAATIPATPDVDVNVIYFPQLGFNIAIPLGDHGTAAYTGSDDDWELMFITENRAYFKDFRMREMDEKLGDIYGIICGRSAELVRNHGDGRTKKRTLTEKEIEIVYDLAQRVLRYENVLVDASDICGDIDRLVPVGHDARSADTNSIVFSLSHKQPASIS